MAVLPLVDTLRVLGVEGGGTRTLWSLFAHGGDEFRLLDGGELPPANFRLTNPDRLAFLLRELPRDAERVGIFLAGCGTPTDRADLAALCGQIWPEATIVTGSDRDSGFAAAFYDGDGIAVNAGTGATITGRRATRAENAGGWGHILGDAGGGYYLALQTLRYVLRDYDLHRRGSKLAQLTLQALGLDNLDALVRWAQNAGKMEIATLAPLVFAAGAKGNAEVREIVHSAARVLAQYTHAVATRLEFVAPPVALLGGLFRHQPFYVEMFTKELTALLPDARVSLANNSPSLGAAWLALHRPAEIAPQMQAAGETAVPLTEQPNERSGDLDQLSARELVDLFVSEEPFVVEALRAAAEALARGIEIITAALANGGRLFHVGAGTSGRLGVLEASEIPPTFGASRDLVQGIIAGGAIALERSVEGAEDDAAAGAAAIDQRQVSMRDVVCGISASGGAAFVRGALARAKERQAKTLLLTCNPAAIYLPNELDLRIDLPTGPELLAGSTRLKAGTATKVALNILSTGAMVRLGRVRGNLMIDLVATNEKLRARATRLVAQLASCNLEKARAVLAQEGWKVRAAFAALNAAGENLRKNKRNRPAADEAE